MVDAGIKRDALNMGGDNRSVSTSSIAFAKRVAVSSKPLMINLARIGEGNRTGTTEYLV
jgi:hypothetical protein